MKKRLTANECLGLAKSVAKKAAKGKDNCSYSPEFNFTECCRRHDDLYDFVRRPEERKAADKILRNCIRAKGHPILASIYYRAVRWFGWLHVTYDK